MEEIKEKIKQELKNKTLEQIKKEKKEIIHMVENHYFSSYRTAREEVEAILTGIENDEIIKRELKEVLGEMANVEN